MNKLTKIILLIIVVFAIGYFSISSYLLPIYNEIVNLQNQLKQKKSELLYLKNVSSKINLLDEIEASIESRLKRLTILLSPTVKEENLIIELQNTAKRAGLDLSNINISELRDLKISKAISVFLSLSGSYNSLINFLGEIEKFPHIMDVNNLSMGGSGEAMNISISATIYYGDKK